MAAPLLPTVVNVNPHMNRPPPDLTEVAVILGDDGVVIPTASLDTLDLVAQNLARVRPPIVAVWGGDGSIGHLISALVRNYGDDPLPSLCFLPGGTMNCIARCLGARGSAGSMLARLRLAIEEGRSIPTVERTPVRIGEVHGFLFGIGLIPNFLNAYNEGATQGPLRALAIFGKTAPGLWRRHSPNDPFFRPFQARLTIGRETWEGAWTNISGGGVACLPLGFEAYTRATEKSGCFQVVAHDLKSWGALYELVSIKLGFGMKRVQTTVTDRVLVELDRKLPFNMDGDNFAPINTFEIASGRKIEVLIP